MERTLDGAPLLQIPVVTRVVLTRRHRRRDKRVIVQLSRFQKISIGSMRNGGGGGSKKLGGFSPPPILYRSHLNSNESGQIDDDNNTLFRKRLQQYDNSFGRHMLRHI